MAAVTVSPSRVWPAIHATSSAVPIRQHRPSLSTSTGAIASGGRLVDDDDAIPGTAVQPSHRLIKPVSNTPLTGARRNPCAVPPFAVIWLLDVRGAEPVPVAGRPCGLPHL